MFSEKMLQLRDCYYDFVASSELRIFLLSLFLSFHFIRINFFHIDFSIPFHCCVVFLLPFLIVNAISSLRVAINVQEQKCFTEIIALILTRLHLQIKAVESAGCDWWTWLAYRRRCSFCSCCAFSLCSDIDANSDCFTIENKNTKENFICKALHLLKRTIALIGM